MASLSPTEVLRRGCLRGVFDGSVAYLGASNEVADGSFVVIAKVPTDVLVRERRSVRGGVLQGVHHVVIFGPLHGFVGAAWTLDSGNLAGEVRVDVPAPDMFARRIEPGRQPGDNTLLRGHGDGVVEEALRLRVSDELSELRDGHVIRQVCDEVSNVGVSKLGDHIGDLTGSLTLGSNFFS